ncbi:RUSC1 protein, partial [Grallaria varia]|nr:RUSC1 protein [Grallaria varia]
VLYSPMAFFALSQGPLPHLADELLLLIQPLSVLTFHLDLLFEHHHLSVDVRPLSRRLASPTRHPAPRPEGPDATLGDEPPADAPGRVGCVGGTTRARCQAGMDGLVPAPPVGAALHQTLQHVLRWGDQLGRALLGAESPPESHRPEEGPGGTGTGLGGWWGQLSQTSRIYITPSKEKLPLVWWTKLRGAAGDPSPGQALQPQTSPGEAGGTELQLLQRRAVPEPSGSADTSGTSSPEDLTLPTGAPAEPDGPTAGEKLPDVSPESRAQGSPSAPSGLASGGPPGPDKGSWLGRLFGATTSPSSRSFPPGPDTISAGSRRPSRWLSPSPRALAGVVKGLAPDRTRAQERPQSSTAPTAQAQRAVRALCDHTGTADGHLSFQKGDILQLLSTVDEDWIRCCHGNSTGLVPVGYTSLIL